MNILIDTDAFEAPIGYSVNVRGQPEDRLVYHSKLPALARLVCRRGLTLEGVQGQVVDALIGWENYETRGQAETKITLFRIVPPSYGDILLSDLLRRAPQKL